MGITSKVSKFLHVHPVQRSGLSFARYESPQCVDEVISLLDQFEGRARIIAGGTDLLLEMQRGVRSDVEVLIDVTRIAGLADVSFQDGSVNIGAGVTHSQVIRSEVIIEHGLPLAQACLEIGSPQLRNRATVVGNLVTASPANDTISALMALDGVITLSSAAGTRRVKVTDFYTGVRGTVLAPNELVTGLSFPAATPARRSVFVKLGLRRAQAISVVHLSCVLEVVEGIVIDARLYLGCVAPVVIPAAEAAASLVGQPLTDWVIEEAARLAAEACRPIDDIRSTAAYRTSAARTMVRRALQTLRDGRERERWPAAPVTLSTPHETPKLNRGFQHVNGEPIRAKVNGRSVETRSEISKTLLDWLREDAGPALAISLTGTKEGCAEGECGACTVYLEDEAVMACLVPAVRAHGSTVATIEGLERSIRPTHDLQQAFIDHGAVQCGFCTPGLIMAGLKLLDEIPSPSLDEIRSGLSGNLCRCTGYYNIIAAVRAAAGKSEESE